MRATLVVDLSAVVVTTHVAAQSAAVVHRLVVDLSAVMLAAHVAVQLVAKHPHSVAVRSVAMQVHQDVSMESACPASLKF